MVTRTGKLASLAAVLLASVAAVGCGISVRAADEDPAWSCVMSTADPGDPERGACASRLPSPGPNLDPATGEQPSLSSVPGSFVPGEYDVCYLVADSEMEALFRRALAAQPAGTRAGGVHDCLWTFDSEPMEMAAIWLGPYNGWADLAGLSADPVAGIGDEALWVLDSQLWVRIGDTAITVMVISESLDTEDASVAIARLAVPRIP
jgi:hypothetical protein